MAYLQGNLNFNPCSVMLKEMRLSNYVKNISLGLNISVIFVSKHKLCPQTVFLLHFRFNANNHTLSLVKRTKIKIL